MKEDTMFFDNIRSGLEGAHGTVEEDEDWDGCYPTDEDEMAGESDEGDDEEVEGEMSDTEKMNWGLCPHGVTDDGDCEQCCGGQSGWDGVGPDW